MKLIGFAAVLVTIATLATAPIANAHGSSAGRHDPDINIHDRISLVRAMAATARFHNVAAAEQAGYGILKDAQQIACIDNPGVGGMGIHYVKGDLVANPSVDASRPEVLVYEPQRNGRLKLVALEYVVFKSAWDATHSSPPTLFGQEFSTIAEGNRYGLPAFYELHAWIWEFNPLGLFNDWNPRVSCAAAPR